MARKVLLSFLGTGDYKPCRYFSDELGESDTVVYVQEAICQLACTDFTEEDRILIFVTEKAKTRHWHLLNEALEKKGVRATAVDNIPEGHSETQIWQIFESIIARLNVEDEVVLDITHAFRSLPMLTMVMLSYAKAVKNITVRGIYYGAFEALGAAHEVILKIPEPSKRRAPLLNLKAFATLQDWTLASEIFKKTGNPKNIDLLISSEIRDILISMKGKDEIAYSIRKLIVSIKKGESEIVANRGSLISKSENFRGARIELEKLGLSDKPIFAPFKHLLESISAKLGNFNSDVQNNRLASIKWCIEHGLVQQGITQLQEAIISFVCEKHQLEPSNQEKRIIVSQAFNIIKKDLQKNENKWKEEALGDKALTLKLIGDPFLSEYNKDFDKLSTIRNDINHGGYNISANPNPTDFLKGLETITKKFEQSLSLVGEQIRYEGIRDNDILLNISNHPTATWQPLQKSTALESIGELADLDFPSVSPEMDDDSLESLINEYERKVLEINPTAIHIMGELTFTYRMVNRLKALGYRCVASTTERVVTEDKMGNKTSSFNFVRFRDY